MLPFNQTIFTRDEKMKINESIIKSNPRGGAGERR